MAPNEAPVGGPIRVSVLASGSGGNATLITAGSTAILVDAGVGPRVVAARMRTATGERVPIDAVVLTHPHGDHVGKAEPVARSFDAPVYMSEATRRRCPLPGVQKRVFGASAPFDIGCLRVEPFPLPHDAPQVGLTFAHGPLRAALVTDLGHVPADLAPRLHSCQLVLLESNYDPSMLAAGPYPEFLKARIASDHGHLSNAQAASLIEDLSLETREIVLMHLSRRNNRPELALRSARAALRDPTVTLSVAPPEGPVSFEVRPTAPSVATATQLALPLPG